MSKRVGTSTKTATPRKNALSKKSESPMKTVTPKKKVSDKSAAQRNETKKPAARGRKPKGYVFPKSLPKGEMLIDLAKKTWCLGPSIGKGGFGEIYSASDDSSKKQQNYDFALKIEPHGNGPLFVEMHFYMKNLKKDDVQAFTKLRKLKHLGVPTYIGSGSHEFDGNKYRFLVLERYGSDIWSLFLDRQKIFEAHTVYQLSLQMLDALEYIHSREYIHGDLKGTNILLGYKKDTAANAYLVDFGLACRYSTENKPDPKKAHNGTIEYTSIDAHKGLSTRRGDMEILGYNIVHWLTGSLPWETCLKNQNEVKSQKEKSMDGLNEFLKKSFGKTTVPPPINSYLQSVKALQFNEMPDYNKYRKYFENGLVSLGYKKNSSLSFESASLNGDDHVTPKKRIKKS